MQTVGNQPMHLWLGAAGRSKQPQFPKLCAALIPGNTDTQLPSEEQGNTQMKNTQSQRKVTIIHIPYAV